MEIIAHRGAWTYRGEKNSMEALCAALELGCGVETDVRDNGGNLVISHDMPESDTLPFSEFIEAYLAQDERPTLALNVKADGLLPSLKSSLERIDPRHYFVFDMSIPDTLPYLQDEMPVFVRVSEIESMTPLVSDAQGIWADELTQPWLTAESMIALTRHGKPVCLVSPELHGRDHLSQWNLLRELSAEHQQIRHWLLCTDYPQEAKEYFSID